MCILHVIKKMGPQEVAQSAETTSHEADVTSSNPPSLLLCGHVKKKKKKKRYMSLLQIRLEKFEGKFYVLLKVAVWVHWAEEFFFFFWRAVRV
jgi:hypothetical protein